MANIKPFWEVVKTSFDLTDIALFFTPAGGGAMIWGAASWATTNVPSSSLIWLVIGLLIIIVPFMLYGISRFMRKVKRQLAKPESMVFRYLTRVDASQLQSGKDYLMLNCSFPSALNYDLHFIKAKCILVIANESSIEKDLSPMIINKQTDNSKYIEISLGDKISSQTRDKIKKKLPMRYKLEIKCWDNDFQEHSLNIEETEMIALA